MISHTWGDFFNLVDLRGFEPPARALGGHCSIHLSYRSIYLYYYSI